jgi:hypothetical protein
MTNDPNASSGASESGTGHTPAPYERRTPIESDPSSGDAALPPGAGDGTGTAEDAEALRQDPDTVPNRLGDPQPPTPEVVGPLSDDDEDLED